jgi:hypothetical protein
MRDANTVGRALPEAESDASNSIKEHQRVPENIIEVSIVKRYQKLSKIKEYQRSKSIKDQRVSKIKEYQRGNGIVTQREIAFAMLMQTRFQRSSFRILDVLSIPKSQARSVARRARTQEVHVAHQHPLKHNARKAP